jgi:large subunit ribosomal protein L30
MPGKLRVTLVKSPISHNPANRATVRALGLHRIGETVEINDTPAVRGMVRAVRFLIKTEEVDGAAATATETATNAKTAPADKPAAARRDTKEKATS